MSRKTFGWLAERKDDLLNNAGSMAQRAKNKVKAFKLRASKPISKESAEIIDDITFMELANTNQTIDVDAVEFIQDQASTVIDFWADIQ